MVTPRGKTRGRPKKEASQPKRKRPRGRPVKHISRDPDRYALAFIAASRKLYQVSYREAAMHASEALAGASKPETLRAKVRVWNSRAKKVRDRRDKSKERNLWKDDIHRMERLAHAVAIALEPGKRSRNQAINEVLTFAGSAREKRFAMRLLIPILDQTERFSTEQ
jgi:hypothetical protein